MNLPELLCPAGDLPRLRAAIDYGADAVYLAGESMGMRTACRNFTVAQLKEAVAFAHSRDKKVYLACNAMLRNRQAAALGELAVQWAACGVDALIVGDLGALRVVKRILPDMPVHISVQTGLANYEAVRMMADLGACRAILARELSLDEIAEIRAKTPASIELEAFVHGSMCVSVSGRCLLSDYLTAEVSTASPALIRDAGVSPVLEHKVAHCGQNIPSGFRMGDISSAQRQASDGYAPSCPSDTAAPLACRSGNGGDCAQPCRWKYALVEEKRPGEYYPIAQTEAGSFLLNSRDLCMISHLPELAAAGVSSLKIEGRAKSVYYTAVTANAYRCALDEWKSAGCPADFQPSNWIQEELNKVSHRPYDTGFYLGGRGGQHTAQGGYVRDWAVMGVVAGYENGRLFVSQRNKLRIGDTVELLEPGQPPFPVTVSELQDADGMAIESTPHPTMLYSFACPRPFHSGTLLRKAAD